MLFRFGIGGGGGDGGAEDVVGAFGVFGGRGGGAEVLYGSALMLRLSPGCGAVGPEPRLGGGGGIVDAIRSPWNGGGTPNFSPFSTVSSIGVFGGRGGGAGPVFDTTRGRGMFAALLVFANLPASAMGGGALNLGGGGPGGGEGSRAGESGGVSSCGEYE